ncbi:MAG: TetR/AcrR family transcriptional regulator [Cyanobacteria bacterium P01_F01_bin.56]
MGRKKLVIERREDILDAFEQCILERGIESSSFQHIAQVLGMDRKIISHYFGNREALVDAMAQRIVDNFDSHMNEVLTKREQSAGFMELVNVFYGQQEAIRRADILWAEIVAYATRSEIVRDRLRQSYEKMFWTMSEALKQDYPNTPENQLQALVYAVVTLLDRSSTFEWLGVMESPIKSAKAAIEIILENLE